MRKFYQTEWHNIPFAGFAEMSAGKIADTAFYDKFYAELFARHDNWDQLDREWLALKKQTADFIADLCKSDRQQSILALGCGLGVIEKHLLTAGLVNLEVTEVSARPLRWLKPLLAEGRAHIGLFPECLPAGKKYGLIYLSNIDYCFDREEFLKLLVAVKQRLRPGGSCLIFSTALDTKGRLSAWLGALKRSRPNGQFWGYLRTRAEFKTPLAQAGYEGITDGFMDKKTKWDTYYILGRAGRRDN